MCVNIKIFSVSQHNVAVSKKHLGQRHFGNQKLVVEKRRGLMFRGVVCGCDFQTETI